MWPINKIWHGKSKNTAPCWVNNPRQNPQADNPEQEINLTAKHDTQVWHTEGKDKSGPEMKSATGAETDTEGQKRASLMPGNQSRM